MIALARLLVRLERLNARINPYSRLSAARRRIAELEVDNVAMRIERRTREQVIVQQAEQLQRFRSIVHHSVDVKV